MAKRKNKKNNNRYLAKSSGRRKKDADEELNDLGLDLDSPMCSVGIVVDSLDIAHMTYLGLININKMCQQYVGLNINLFCRHISSPCINPLCTVSSIKDIFTWQRPLIATSINSCLDSLNSMSTLIYHYAFDMDFIERYDLSTEDLQRTFCDPRVRVLARHKDHAELLSKEFGLDAIPAVMPDFPVVEIIKMLLLEMKNVAISH